MLERIASACARAGRPPGQVTLVAVSKTVPPERLRAAVAAGLTVLGENSVPELVRKVPLVPGASWHFVGHLQGNKARPALEACAVVHSVDSLALARRLDRLAGEVGGPAWPAGVTLPIYLEVNVDADPAKAGFTPAALGEVLAELGELAQLRLEGLMTVGRLVSRAELARPTFVALRELSERLRTTSAALGPGLSMGMSDDFEVAVEEGATAVRIGRAIFGERPPA
ncbi:MAG: YggS family pyridoxal phosphate-dependent enzyme [Candidatus Limnocylindrales bacterium]